MLAETAHPIPGTSWFFLQNAAGQFLDPFDLMIYAGPPLHPVHPPQQYQLVAGDRATLNGIHTHRMALAIQNLPHNNHIEDNPAEFSNHDTVNVPEAVMDPAGPSQPVARVGVGAAVKTYGAGPCLPLLVRATAANNTRGVGCVHLSANDMESWQDAQNGIMGMCGQLRTQLADLTATCHCFLAGGSIAPEHDDDVLDEYARTVAALQTLAANAANHMVFDGALVPASDQDGDYIDVLITTTHIYYQEDNVGSGSGSGDGENSS